MYINAKYRTTLWDEDSLEQSVSMLIHAVVLSWTCGSKARWECYMNDLPLRFVLHHTAPHMEQWVKITMA